MKDKKANMHKIFSDLKSNYPLEIKDAKTTNELVISSEIIKSLVPDYIRSSLSLDESFFKVKGSVGAGNIAAVPWVCIFDKDVTASAQHGFYIVLLFRPDMSGFYVSLNQGWTQYEKGFKPLSHAREKIVRNASICRQALKAVHLNSQPIDLKASGNLARGYELGNIYSRHFDLIGEFSEYEFVKTLNEFVFIYSQLKNLIGKNILAITGIVEEEYQDVAQSGDLSGGRSLDSGPIPLGEKSESTRSSSSGWSRSVDIAHSALEEANYQCFFDGSHSTFTSRRSLMPFMEAHHLIPMEHQEKFEYSLDVPENILCICPNCHRQVHHAIDAEVKPMLEQAFLTRQKDLLDRGLKLDLADLYKLYF
jgi:5-methylcytosine-specific restriction protein A